MQSMQMILMEKLTRFTEGSLSRVLLSGHRRLGLCFPSLNQAGECGGYGGEGAACREGFKSRSRKKKFKTG